LSERALREARRGRDVFCNYNLRGTYSFTPDQLLDLPPGLIVIDEAHLWFPARMSLRLPPSWLAMVSQTRKNGWDILWAAQHESRVDRALRDVSSWQWLCSAWFTWGGHPLFFKAVSYEPEFFRDPKRKMVTTWRTFSMGVASAYDTYQRLTVAEHAQSSTDPYARKSARGRTSSVLEGLVGDES
jgi:hypothetical protein